MGSYKRAFKQFKSFLDAGADSNIADTKGNTALHIAVLENAGAAFIRLLLQNKARAEQKNNSGQSCYDLALEKEDFLEKKVILKLLKN